MLSVKSVFALSRLKRAVINRFKSRVALGSENQRRKKIVKFSGIASIRGMETYYGSLEHFTHDIPNIRPAESYDYLVAQQFITEEFLAEDRPKVFFSREPMAHHQSRLLSLLNSSELSPHVISFGEENIYLRMFYVALPTNKNGIAKRRSKSLHNQRASLCCIVNRYKESDRLNLLAQRIRFVKAMGEDIDIYGRPAPDGPDGWQDYPGYRGACANKLNTLEKYTFNLCFENCDEDGYITEKIIHALMAGCIPLYWGGGRFLGQTIPGNCFIDCRDQDPAMVYQRMRAMSTDEILVYRQAGLEFINSDEADRFTWRYWAELVASRLLNSGST